MPDQEANPLSADARGAGSAGSGSPPADSGSDAAKAHQEKEKMRMQTLTFWLRLVGALLTILLGAKTFYEWGKSDGSAQAIIGAAPQQGDSIAATVNVTVKEEEFQGWFGDIDTDGRFVVTEEPSVFARLEQRNGNSYMHLTVTKSSAEIRVSAEESEPHDWSYIGFKSGDYISFSYASDDISRNGIGVCLLKATGYGYEGFWIGRDTGNTKMIWAPYVLLRKRITKKEAMERFPILSWKPRSAEFETWEDFFKN